MATAATHTPFPSLQPIEIKWLDSRLYNRNNNIFDGTNCIDYTTVMSINNLMTEVNNNIENNITELTTSKSFVKNIQKILKEYNLLNNYFPNFSELELLNRLEPSLSSFLEISSDLFSVELTKDETIFFTIKKGDFTFYIEQYLDDEIDSEEFILTAFDKKDIVINKSGNKSELTMTLNNIVNN